jgi:cytidylate kinase
MKYRISDRSIDVNLHPILASVRATEEDIEHAEHGGPKSPKPPKPFVTISRQPGAGAWTLAQRLVERLNALDPGDPPWTCWEKELVEKVAADHHIARELVQSLGERSRTWLEEVFAGFSTHAAQYAEEFAVYRHVAATVRALAQIGRVVIVGRGGVFITRDLPGGIHLRLVAPLPYRVAAMARSLNIPEADAATVVREMERAREAFHHRYWPRETMAPETYTAVLNTQAVGEDRLADWVAALIVQQCPAGQARQVVPA